MSGVAGAGPRGGDFLSLQSLPMGLWAAAVTIKQQLDVKKGNTRITHLFMELEYIDLTKPMLEDWTLCDPTPQSPFQETLRERKDAL